MDCERRETQYITFGFKMDLFYSKLKHKTQFKDNAHTVRKYAMQQQHAEHTYPTLFEKWKKKHCYMEYF